MAITNTQTTYGSVSKFFHWTIFLIVIVLLTVGFFMGDIADKPTKFQVISLHKSFGLTVLALMVLRILWTMTNTHPGYDPSMPAWEKKSARGLHFLLYILLLVMPFSGWIMSTAADHIPNVFGLFQLPFPGIEVNKPFSKLVHEVHEYTAWILIAALVLHVVAALKHHYINKDNILKRMLPFTK